MKKEVYLLIGMVLVVVISSVFVVVRLNESVSGNVVISEEESDVQIEDREEVSVKEEEIIEKGFVSKIIDGDTIVIDGESVRLLGIDADERGYDCYKEASERLEELVLNKEVELLRDGENKDQYSRYLRFIFLDDENINLKLVEEGLAIARFGSGKRYKEEILEAEKNARLNGIGCKWGDVEIEEDLEEESDEDDEEYVCLGCEDELEDNREEVELEDGVIFVCNAGNYLGEDKVVEGLVVDVYRSNSDTVFLNFEKPYPNQCFTGVIFKSYLNEFSDYENYEDERIRLSGKIEEYKSKYEIILKDREQLEIV